MNTANDYNGDQCIVLPADFLKTPQAAAELYADDVNRVANNLHVPEFDQGMNFVQVFVRLSLLGVLLTLMPF